MFRHRHLLMLWYDAQLWTSAGKRLTSRQEVGVDVLEMDTVFTSDGVPVIWHDVSDSQIVLWGLSDHHLNSIGSTPLSALENTSTNTLQT